MATVSIFNLLTGSSTPLLASGDVVPFVDISDTTQSAQGSTVKATLTQFFAAIPVPIIVTNTGTQLQLKYDGSNHVTVAVSSAGAVTITATGASAGVTFANAITGTTGTFTPTSANSVITALAVRNTNNGNAAGTGVNFGNDFSANAGTLRVYSSAHATLPGHFRLINEANAPLVLGANGATAVTIAGTGAVTFVAGITATTGTFSDNVQIATGKSLYFGGTTSSFPKFKNSSADLFLQLGDESGYANLTLAQLTATGVTTGSGPWTFGVANVVSPTSPNRTLTVTISGTTYYIAAKTTNN